MITATLVNRSGLPCWCCGLVLLLFAPPALAQPAAPKPPAEYNAFIRYQIDAFRTEHIRQFDEMVDALAKLGFHKGPGPDDERESRAVNRMAGTVASADARKLLNQRHVKTILLVPRGAELPADAEQPLRVQIELASGLDREAQRRLAEQVRSVLAPLGFREAVGYDHRGQTRLVGMIPFSRLDALLNDLRKHPAGAKLPAPFALVSPLRIVEVMTGMESTVDRPAPVVVPRELENVGPGLRALLEAKKEAGNPIRLEVILNHTPTDIDRTWRRPLQEAVPGLLIDGRLGPLVSVRCTPEQGVALAAVPTVSAVRLPQPARPQEQAPPPANADLREALKASGLERLHALGHRGKGIRAAVVDGDFRGWQAAVGKELPAKVTLIDLTRGRNYDLEPDPFPGDANAVGHGTRCAALLMKAAPEAELVLIRVDPASPYQLQEAARAINGELFRSLALDGRGGEIENDRQLLENRRDDLLEERRFILNSVDDADLIKQRWDAYKKKQEQFDRDEQSLNARTRNYVQLRRDLRDLKGVAVVACPLVWNEGHPVDGTGALSRYFDDRPFKAALWFQSAGNTRGQAWAGLFRDADGDGVMEFTAPGVSLPKGRWTPELNFLAWQPSAEAGRGPSPDVPAKTRLRLAVQWREAHDPELYRRGEDAFRVPLADLRLLILRQRDPLGEKLPADDLEVVAQSVGVPLRLTNEPSASVYEQTVEFAAEAGGRYVVRVEGRAPIGTRPANAPTVPAALQLSDLHLRLFIETLSPGGRAVFADFVSDRPGRESGASLGTPAESRQVITVGAADRTGQPQVYSSGGAPFGLELLSKPDVLAYDEFGAAGETLGTSLATSFAAGLAATALGSGAPCGRFLEAMRARPGEVLRIPGDWPARR